MAMPENLNLKTQGNLGQELAEKQANVDAFKAAPANPPKASSTPGAAVDHVNAAPKARYGARTGEQRIDTKSMTKPLGSFKEGTPHVPKTGIYKLHEGEAVIPKDKNMADSIKDKMMDHLGGDKKPKKEIKEMHIRKTANGKHIVTHKHHHPEYHPDEEHSMEDMGALHQHMEDHAGTPNDGEGAESAPPAGAAQMTAAPSPAAPAAAPAAGASPTGM